MNGTILLLLFYFADVLANRQRWGRKSVNQLAGLSEINGGLVQHLSKVTCWKKVKPALILSRPAIASHFNQQSVTIITLTWQRMWNFALELSKFHMVVPGVASCRLSLLLSGIRISVSPEEQLWWTMLKVLGFSRASPVSSISFHHPLGVYR